MDLYVKVPPNKGNGACILKFKNAHLKKSVLNYSSFTVFCDVPCNQYIPKIPIDHRLKYKAFFHETKDLSNLSIVVSSGGFDRNEKVFRAQFGHFDTKIPLVDYMICFFWSGPSRKLSYKKIETTPQTDVPKSSLLSALGGEVDKLTRRERRLLGLE